MAFCLLSLVEDDLNFFSNVCGLWRVIHSSNLCNFLLKLILIYVICSWWICLFKFLSF